MTLYQPMFVNGATHPGNTVRRMIRDLAQQNEGVVAGDHLKVRQIDTPTDMVRAVDGSAFIKGKFAAAQGTYHISNIGDETIGIAPTGASPRTDMVVLRIEDPEYEGNLVPGSEVVGHLEVISPVGASATEVPNSSWSAIPLARITIPANTSAITDGMITSIRKVANPRRQRDIFIANHPTGTENYHNLTSSSLTHWPNSASWSVPIPVWATSVKIIGQVSGPNLSTSGMTGGMRATLGGASLATQQVALSFDTPAGTNRQHMAFADTRVVPSTLRGTTATLRIEASRTSGTGILRADQGTVSIVDVEFVEAPI